MKVRASMRRRRRCAQVGVVALSFVAWSATTSVTTATLADPALGCTDERNLALQAETQAVYERIGQSAAFTGLGLFDRCGPIKVFSTGADPGLAAAALLAAPAADLSFHVVPNSLATLFAVQDRITADMPSLQAQGLTIDRYWPDMETGMEKIEVVDATPAQLASLTARYGADRTLAVSVDEAEPAVTLEDASNDTPPFNGGIFMVRVNAQNQVIGLCTAAYGVHTGTGPAAPHYLLTAGHCSLDAGAPVTNSAWNNAVITDANGGVAGSLLPIGVMSKNFLSQNIDGALIDVPAGTTTIWQGWYTSGYLNSQKSAARAQVGTNVCTDGAYDGLRCGAIVQSAGYLGCKTVTGVTKQFCKVIPAIRSDGVVVGGKGDSGAAMMGLGPLQTAFGVLSIGVGPLKACPHFTWRGNVCSNSIYFTDLLSIFEKAGAGTAVNTSSNP